MRLLLFGLLSILLLVAACGGMQECKGAEEGYDLCVLNTATQQGDASLCIHITMPSFRIWCYNSVANATDSLDTCELIDDSSAIEFCKQKLYIKWDELDACDSLTYDLAKDGCFAAFALEQLDATVCTGIIEPGHREDCIEDISRLALDPYSCLLLSNDNLDRKNACILSMSIAAKNVETCNEIIDNETLTGFCILNIAIALDDPSLCALIEDSAASAICNSEFNIA